MSIFFRGDYCPREQIVIIPAFQIYSKYSIGILRESLMKSTELFTYYF